MDTTIGTARQMNHDFVFSGDFKNTALNDLSFSLNETVKESHDRGESSNLLISPLGEVRQNTRTGDNGNDIRLNGSFTWKNNDLGKLRPRVTLSGAFANNTTLSWNTDTLSSSYIRRNLQSDGLGRSWDIKEQGDLDIVLVNDTKKTSNLNFAAFAGIEKSTKRNITVDIIDPLSPIRNLANTYDYTWNTVSGGLSQNYTTTKGGNKFTASVTESISSQRDDERLPQGKIRQTQFLFQIERKP